MKDESTFISRESLDRRTAFSPAVEGKVNPGLDLGQDYLHPRIRGREGLHVEGGHGGSVGPQHPVLDIVQREIVAADVVAHTGEELVPLVGGGGHAPLHVGVDHQGVVDVDEEGDLVGPGQCRKSVKSYY